MKQLRQKLAANPPGVYYTPQFRTVIEDHLPIIIDRHSTHQPLNENSINLLYVYRYDFYGFLKNHNVNFEYHWVTLRANGFVTPMVDFTHITELIIPDSNYITNLANLSK